MRPAFFGNTRSLSEWPNQRTHTQSLVAFALAGAGLTAGTILWFFYRPTLDPPSRVPGDIQVGIGPSQITMSGRF